MEIIKVLPSNTKNQVTTFKEFFRQALMLLKHDRKFKTLINYKKRIRLLPNRTLYSKLSLKRKTRMRHKHS